MPKTRPPLIVDDAMARQLIRKRAKTMYKSPTLSKLGEADREYLRGMFNVFKKRIEQRIADTEGRHLHGNYRYTPRQMWENTKKYFEYSIEYGQPLAVMGIATFNGVDRKDLMTNQKEIPKAFDFLKDCVTFVQLYNEYAAHKKMNPAGPIFILKNFGWKDKYDIEASTTAGALTEEQRAEYQKRLTEFTEEKLLPPTP